MEEDIARWGRSSDGSDFLLLPNGVIDTEDRNGNFELEPNEDTGLDGIAFDDDEWIFVRDSLDDGRDDYPKKLNTFQDSLKLHRKEGNRRLDSEDLNRDYTLESKSEFFRYKIDLESTPRRKESIPSTTMTSDESTISPYPILNSLLDEAAVITIL
ncbi:hypothetical protein ES703_112211 [subsurface metagenome]